MMEKFFERLAAKKDNRFHEFIEGKAAYEEFVQEMGIGFEKMSEEQYLLARDDPRIIFAERRFVAALEMSQDEGVLADSAVAKYQLGLVSHVCGELDEAAVLMREALEVLGNIPRRKRAEDMSACLYHLGVIALKHGHFDDAVRDLRRSRKMDEVLGDFVGMQLCDFALVACAEAGANIESDAILCSEDAFNWDKLNNEIEDYSKETEEQEIASGPVRYSRRELICVASYSVKANDDLMAYIQDLGDEFGRPVDVTRTAFGAAEPEKRKAITEPDQHLCATILVLEKRGLKDKAFQEFAVLCMRLVVAEPDFRLLVYLNDLTLEELRDLSDREPFIAELFDTTQIAESPSLTQLRRTLVPYIRQVEHIGAMESWRVVRLRFASVCGYLSMVLLMTAVLVSLLGIPVSLSKINLFWFEPYGPQVAALVLGLLAFPLQAPLIFFLLRGMRVTAIAPRDNRLLMRWIGIGAVIIVCANLLQNQMDGPYSWLFLGSAIGVLLDVIRRGGIQARRQMINCETFINDASSPVMNDPKVTVLRGDSFKPFSCPLIPTTSARVFISYTQSSAKGSKLAAALHKGLKGVGASPFLDRSSIPPGASWRRSLNQHLGECDTFVCILDTVSVKREWVAAELLAAIEARHLTGTPNIVVLIDPEIQQSSQVMLPIFSGVVSAAKEPPIQGRPQLMLMNDKSLSSLVWGLAPGRFIPISVFTRLAALPIVLAIGLLALVGGIGIFTGPILGFLAFLEQATKFPLTQGVDERGWMELMTLLSALWLGFMGRSAIGLQYERNKSKDIGMVTIAAISSFGLVFSLALFISKASIIVVCWSVVLFITSWMVSASVIRSDAGIFNTAYSTKKTNSTI